MKRNRTNNKHLNVRWPQLRIYVTQSNKKCVSDISYTDLSPVPVWSAMKSYLTSWFSQNLSNGKGASIKCLYCYSVSTLFIFSERTTLRSLYAISRPSVVCCLSVCLSVCCLSVTLVHPTQAVKLFGNFFSPYDSSGTLLFWCQNRWWGTPLSPWNFRSKWPTPLSNSKISTNIGL